MSFQSDINSEFDDLIKKIPDKEYDILICKFGVFESLDWDSAAKETAKEIQKKGYEIDGNMRCYISS